MYVYDFEYDGRLLSDFGFELCSFDESDQETTKGAEIVFTTVPMRNGERFFNAGSKYDKCLSATLQICKDGCLAGEEDMRITNEEFRALSRWLNRREFLWFREHDEDSWRSEMRRPWFRASFTLSKIEIDGKIYGVELEMTTDAPFGYGDEEVINIEFASGALTQTIVDMNDEIGTSFPEADITCGSSGTLKLTNVMTGCQFEVKNVVSSEEIHLSGDTMIITSSVVNHDIANDFNYDFFSIGNSYDSRENEITSTIPCSVTLRYRPIWKDTI